LPVSVEISGLLERRLRRLVDLGLYSSVSEAVRDAVRMLFDRLDLRALALELYTSREASLGYVAEFSGDGFEPLIDYMLSRGVAPALGAFSEGDVGVLEGSAVLDPVAVYVVYRSYLADLASRLAGSGLKFYAPSALEPQIQVFEAVRARRGMGFTRFLELVEIEVVEEEYGRVLVTPLERAVVEYAAREGLTLLSDDVRVRGFARRLGVRALSSLSILETYTARFGRPGNVGELLLTLKAIPVAIPRGLEERWLGV